MEILVIEDNVALSEMIQQSLAEADLANQLDVVHDGTDAFAAINKKRYDLIFTDLNIPKISGETLVEQLQETKNALSAIIVASGFYNFEIKQKLKWAHQGPIYFLPKPYTIDKMLQYCNTIRSSIEAKSI